MGKTCKKNKMALSKSPSSSSPAPVTPFPMEHSFETVLAEELRIDDECSVKGGCDKTCRHLEKGVNVDKLSFQLAKTKSTLTQCQDCAKDMKAGMQRKSKARSGKKKSIQSPIPNYCTKRWICLACGHIGCGTISSLASHTGEKDDNRLEQAREDEMGTGHAWKHWLYTKHHLAVLCGDKLVCWCFPCKAAIDYNFIETVPSDPGHVEEKPPFGSGLLQHAVQLVREKFVKELAGLKNPLRSGDTVLNNEVSFEAVKDINLSTGFEAPWFIEGCHGLLQRKRVVKGLMNLGNTCFFNSVMQNLLALNLLRDYFCEESKVVEGPLTSSLRKLYLETDVNESGPISRTSAQAEVTGFESGSKKAGKGRVSWESNAGVAYNPRTLFGAICAKAPRFRGFQQQDSHELLRCLLDGLHTEQGTRMTEAGHVRTNGVGAGLEGLHESGSPKSEMKIDNRQLATFVEHFFGGQLSSRVCCYECGYSSVVYEPFLDLSLQIPAKHASKKHQGRSSQATSLPFGGRLERGKKTIYPEQDVGLSNNSQPSKQVIIDHQEPQLQLPSAASMHTASSTSIQANSIEVKKVGVVNADAIDDFGWLDFLGGGMQSAQGSLQGPCGFVVCVPQVKKSNGSLDDGNEPERCSSSISCSSPISCLPVTHDENGCLHSPVPSDSTVHDIACREERVGNSNGLEKDASINSQDSWQDVNIEADDEALVIEEAQLMQEDEAPMLPLTSDVLLLPYEKLQLPCLDAMEETGNCSEIGKSSSDLFSCIEENAAPSIEQDDGDFDGFSQLFENEDSTFLENKGGKTGEHPEDLGPENSMDAIWEAHGSPDIEGECDVPLFSSVKEIKCQDGILPMSLEGCLADFTKSELLCGENAWACENCSKRCIGKLDLSATDAGSKKSEQCSTYFKVSGKENLGKGRSADCRRSFESNEISTSNSKGFSDGEIIHDVVNDTTVECSSSQLRDVLEATSVSSLKEKDVSDSFTEQVYTGPRGCCKAGCNGTSESSLEPNDRRLMTRMIEVDPRFRNSFARLNELGSGQPSVEQSVSTRVADDSGHSNCNEPLVGKAVNELNFGGEKRQPDGAQQERERVFEENGSPIGRGKACFDFDGFKRTEQISSAQSSGKHQGQRDSLDARDSNFGASSSLSIAEPSSTYHVPRRLLKLQRAKSKRTEDSEKVVKRDATKRLLISKAPLILTIHLKRFGQDMRGQLSKLSGHVAFQEWLDLRPFLDSKCADNENCIYRLVGIVEHAGTMRGGHYVAYVRGPPTSDQGSQDVEREDLGKNTWYCISDSHVRKSTLQAVLNSEAYLLFYEKCKYN